MRVRAGQWCVAVVAVCVLVSGAVPGISDVAATAAGPSAQTSFCSPSPPGTSLSVVSGGFHAVTPTRVLDTRIVTGPVGAGCTAVVDMSGVVPAEAVGVALDVVAVDAAGPGFVTVYPCESSRPLASNVNPRVGDPTPNAVLVPLGSSERVCLYTSIQSDLVVDVTGWFGVAGASFHGVTPARVLDTRFGPRPDGGFGPVPGGTVIRIPMAGMDPIPAGATAVAANLTVTDTQDSGFVTAYPCGDLPLASNGNYLADDIRANQAIVGLDGGGGLCVYVSSTTDLVVDVTGWFGGTDGQRLLPVVGTRVLDSRNGTGGWSGPIQAGQTLDFDPTMGGTVAVGANAALDVVATRAAGPGYLTLFPCGGPLPPTSTVNYSAGAEATNFAVIPLSADAHICVFSMRTTDVVVDVLGSFGPAGALHTLDVSPGPLTPAFSPDGHDYGVICSAGSNAWTVTASAVPGATVSIAGADSSGDVTVTENQAVVVTVTLANATSDQYWIRCLPHDFPVLSVNRPDDPTPGYYLFGTFSSAAGYAIILDTHGAPVWYHKTTAGGAMNVNLLPDGDVAWSPLLGTAFGTNPSGAVQEHALDGTLVKTWSTVATPTDHHDFVPLANGDMLIDSYHYRANVDVSALSGCSPGQTANVEDDWIQEIKPDGTVAWQWHSEDHIGLAETMPTQPCGTDLTFSHGFDPNLPAPVIDLLHVNSLDVDPTTGNVIVSGRHLNAAFEIRRDPGQPDDGKILWKLGGDAPTDPAAVHYTIVNDPLGGPVRQHDVRLLPNGHLTMFDNESGVTSPRAVEYALDPNDATATLVWQYGRTDSGQAFGLGSVRRQGDGSTVIGWGPLPPVLSDLGPLGNVTLEVSEVPTANNYRTIKVPVASLNLATLRADAGLNPGL